MVTIVKMITYQFYGIYCMSTISVHKKCCNYIFGSAVVIKCTWYPAWSLSAHFDIIALNGRKIGSICINIQRCFSFIQIEQVTWLQQTFVHCKVRMKLLLNANRLMHCELQLFLSRRYETSPFCLGKCWH